ncbi:hypothetical protein [Taibaiella koreensis]|uniref:hypothetical protein n=1 Tax=Taibaiella koreensis TaxID=1268548 RepID=UPI000E59B385|nr:hypothetical protein [Taibaiella koreensis]
MPSEATRQRKRKAFYLLLACICFFATGVAMLTLGAVVHVNPKITFAGFFKLEPYMNVVSTIFALN